PVVDLGEHLEVPGYTPSPRLREQVLLTHPTCVFPGCSRPSRGCDLDHVVPWADGGPTCSCNLVPECRFHHRLKTHGGWTLHRVGHRLLVWTSPHGRTYTRHTD
ncbi:HNH endonuclease signature motif containing protein, partial [Nocardioides sp.]|uniref:HNH endonuclease signature motif containing protein n=1 Tax=Nocardioides sp. TaxID=35761 RepID=UPI0025E7E97D